MVWHCVGKQYSQRLVSNFTVYFQIGISCGQSKSVSYKLFSFLSFNESVLIKVMFLPHFIDIFLKICIYHNLIILFLIHFQLLLQFLFEFAVNQIILFHRLYGLLFYLEADLFNFGVIGCLVEFLGLTIILLLNFYSQAIHVSSFDPV